MLDHLTTSALPDTSADRDLCHLTVSHSDGARLRMLEYPNSAVTLSLTLSELFFNFECWSLPNALRHVKLAAIDTVWSALKL